MGRIRTLKPEFFRSRSLAKCSRDARLTFQGLWCEADDYGRGIADSRILKGAIWPLDDDVQWSDVETHLKELAETGHLSLYEVDGERFYLIVAWDEHQAAAYRRGKSVYPSPEEGTPAEPLPVAACKNVQAARKSVLERGTRNEERGASATPDAPAPTRSPREETKTKRGTRIPDEFFVSDEMYQWALENAPGVNVERETQKFVNYWAAQPGQRGVKVRWVGTWQNWLLKAAEYQGAAR